jgi:hypothetical protein
MAERVSFYSGKVEAEFVSHPIDLPSAPGFLRSEPKEKCLMHGVPF